jgi:cytochrome c biogenesis protein CcmG, thiol:disulfide interchange protein DsbE
MSTVTTVGPPRSWQQRVRESRFGTLLVLTITAVLVMGGAYLVERPSAAAGTTAVKLSQEGKGPAPKIGSPSQDFSATTVDGKKVSLSQYKGQAVWLTFGATWCAPCQAEAPDIQATYEKFKADGVVVLSVSISEDASAVADFGQRLGLTYPQIADPDTNIASAYRVSGIPAHFFIDKAGNLDSMRAGGLSPEQMAAAVREALR